MKETIFRYVLTLGTILLRDLWYQLLSPLTIYVNYWFFLLYLPVSLAGNTLSINGTSFEFVQACIAVSAYLIFTALVLLTKGVTVNKRLQMLGIGFVAIFVANMLRVQVLINIYFYFGKNFFDSVHLLFWHFISAIFVFFIWVYLSKKYKIRNIPVYSDLKYLLNKI